MKRLIIPLLILAAQVSFAQTASNPLPIKFNFKDKKFIGATAKGGSTLCEKLSRSPFNGLKSGNFYQISIENINTNLYNVTINKKDSVIQSGVEFPSLELIGLDGIDKVIANIVPSAFASKIQASPDLGSPNIMSLDIEKDPEIKELLDKAGNENVKIKVLLTIALCKLAVEDILQESKEPAKEANELLYRLNLQALSYLESLSAAPDTPILKKTDKFKLSEVVHLTDEKRHNLEIVEDKLTKLKKEYNKFKSGVEKLYQEDKEIKKQDEELAATFKEAGEVLASHVSKISRDSITNYLNSVIHLENHSDRTFTSLPIQHNGDISKLSIIISPLKPEYGQTYTVEYQFPENKMYAGISGSFYFASGFRNDLYSTRETHTSDTTSYFSIVKEGTEKSEVGFATLLHVGSTLSNSRLGVHVTVGPALSLSAKPQIRLALGAGVSAGSHKNKVTVNLLGMAGYVQKISKVFNETEKYNSKPEQITVSKLAGAFAVSVGYIYKF